MKQYLDFLAAIKAKQSVRQDRTGTGTMAIFGHQMRFNLKEGFPLVTSKKVFVRGLIEELLWIIRGSTNNQELVDKNVHIWDSWAIPEDITQETYKQGFELALELAKVLDKPQDEVVNMLMQADRDANIQNHNPEDPEPKGAMKIIKDNGLSLKKTVVIVKKGSLGPVYGEQWRRWYPTFDGKPVDQLAEAIQTIKSNPKSRRIIVNSWNPAVLPNELLSPQQNVEQGRMALAPCHCLFQFDVEPYTEQEFLRALREKNLSEAAQEFDQLIQQEAGRDDIMAKMYELHHQYGVHMQRLSCQLYQRSADGPLGVPFNIASYALLTHMVAQVCDMDVGDFIWTGGNCHIYSNQHEGVDLQLPREPRQLPTLWLNPEIKDIDKSTIDDIRIDGYDPHPEIKYPSAAV